MTESVHHRPGLHCHHYVEAVECTLCTYLAMEAVHNKKIMDLIDDESTQATQIPTEASEES